MKSVSKPRPITIHESTYLDSGAPITSFVYLWDIEDEGSVLVSHTMIGVVEVSYIRRGLWGL